MVSFFELRIRETLVIDEILDRWNGFIATLQEEIERMKIKVMARTAEHSSGAHRHAEEANGKLDSMAKKMDDTGNDLKTVIQRQDQLLLSFAKMQTAERSAEAGTWCLQHKDTGAEAQTGMFNDMTAIVEEQRRDKDYYRRLWESQMKESSLLQASKSPISSGSAVTWTSKAQY